MILREAVALTFVLIAALNLMLGGSLFYSFYTTAQRDCHQRNAEMFEAGKQGPPQPCL